MRNVYAMGDVFIQTRIFKRMLLSWEQSHDLRVLRRVALTNIFAILTLCLLRNESN